MRKITSNEKEEEECRVTTTSTRVADTFGFFSMMMRFFHSSATSVPAWGASRSSSSSYGQTAPGYYSSYSRTSGGSVSFPSLGSIFSSIPRASPSDQSLSSSDALYSSVQDSACRNTCLIPATLTHLPYLPHLILLAVVPLVPIPPALHWVSLCRLCEKICLLILSSLFSLYS